MSSLLGTFRKEDAVVGNDTDWMTVEVAVACNESSAVALLKLVESAAVEQAAKHLVHIEVSLVVGWDDTVELVCVE